MNKRIIILLLIAIIAIAMVVGCGNSPELVTTTIPEPVCAVINNQLCVGDSAIFYDANLNADVSYYGLGSSGANYIYYLSVFFSIKINPDLALANRGYFFIKTTFLLLNIF